MHVMEPRYTVSCRKAMGLIDDKYYKLKDKGVPVCHQPHTVYVDIQRAKTATLFSLTAHYITDNFVITI